MKASENIRYLTGSSDSPESQEPKRSNRGWRHRGTYERRPRNHASTSQGLYFSDGTPFTSGRRRIHDECSWTRNFTRNGDAIRARVRAPSMCRLHLLILVRLRFPARVAGLGAALRSSRHFFIGALTPKKRMAVLGPFYVSEYKPAAYRRASKRYSELLGNMNQQGRPLPYFEGLPPGHPKKSRHRTAPLPPREIAIDQPARFRVSVRLQEEKMQRGPHAGAGL